MQELWFLRFACRLMLTEIHIKFREVSWMVFKLYSRHVFFMTDKVSREIIKKVQMQKL